jgi:hypothetical protein
MSNDYAVMIQKGFAAKDRRIAELEVQLTAALEWIEIARIKLDREALKAIDKTIEADCKRAALQTKEGEGQ